MRVSFWEEEIGVVWRETHCDAQGSTLGRQRVARMGMPAQCSDTH